MLVIETWAEMVVAHAEDVIPLPRSALVGFHLMKFADALLILCRVHCSFPGHGTFVSHGPKNSYLMLDICNPGHLIQHDPCEIRHHLDL